MGMASGSKFKMAAVGDINLRDFSTAGDHFAEIMPYLETMSCAIGNLEGLFAEPEELFYKPGFKHVGEGHAPTLANAGFKAVNMANNVTFGAKAIETTLRQLDEVGIAHTGAGMNRTQAKAPVKITVGGYTLGIVGRTSIFWPHGHEATDEQAGVMPLRVSTSYRPHRRHYELPGARPDVITIPDEDELNELKRDIEALRPEVDLLVAFFHFGVSSERDVAQYQRTVARASIDAGADVVLGSQSHVIQPIEVYRDCPIVYGMGQVIFGWEFISRQLLPGQPGLIVELDIDEDDNPNWSAQIVVPDDDTLTPRIVPLDEVPEEVSYLRKTSSDAVDFVDGRIRIKARGRRTA